MNKTEALKTEKDGLDIQEAMFVEDYLEVRFAKEPAEQAAADGGKGARGG